MSKKIIISIFCVSFMLLAFSIAAAHHTSVFKAAQPNDSASDISVEGGGMPTELNEFEEEYNITYHTNIHDYFPHLDEIKLYITDNITSTRTLAESLPRWESGIAKYDEAYFNDSFLHLIHFALPGTTRNVRITNVVDEGDTLDIEMTIEYPRLQSSDVVPWTIAFEMDRRLLVKDISFTINAVEEQRVLDCSPEFPALPPDESTAIISVTTISPDISWSIPTSNRDWLTVSDIAPADRTGNGSFTISATDNTGATDRSASVTITSDDGSVASIWVWQHGGVLPTLAIGQSTWHPASGASSTVITVSSNTTWNTPVSSQPWLTISDIAPADRTGNGSFAISVADNTDAFSRRGHITIRGGGINRDISVIQAGVPKVTIEDAIARPDGEFSVGLRLEKDIALKAMSLEVSFDDDYLTLVSIEDAGLMGTAKHSLGSGDSPPSLKWEDGEIEDGAYVDGVVATLTFKVSERAPVGNYGIGLLAKAEHDVMDIFENPVSISQSGGGLEVLIIYGNLRGGLDAPEAMDSILLTRFLADWPGIKIFKQAADLDQDGAITPRDSLILRRHLAGWQGYQALPLPIAAL